MGIHLFRYTHGGERTIYHDVVRDAFSYVMKHAWFHVFWEQTHIFLPSSFQSFHWWVNIILSIDGICTLADVIIVDPSQAYLVSWLVISCGVAVIVTVQVKEGFYCDHYPTNMFLPLAIKVLGVFTSSWTTFFNDVLTWHGQQKVTKALIYRCCREV